MAGLGNFEIENRVFDYTRFFVIIFLQKDFYFFKWLVFDYSNNIFDIDGIFEVLGKYTRIIDKIAYIAFYDEVIF